MAEQNENLWAPWRMPYLKGLSEKERAARQQEATGCFLCHYRERPKQDPDNHVLWRSSRTLTLLNRYPYTNGHLLIAPFEHVEHLEELTDQTLAEITARIRDATRVLRRAMNCGGFNVGANLGRCAGAGLPEHLHWHVVPRWAGDTNFVPVLGGVRVIPQTLDDVRDDFLRAAGELGLS